MVSVEGTGGDDCSSRWAVAVPSAVAAYQERVLVDPDETPTRTPSNLGTTLVVVFSLIFALLVIAALVVVARLILTRQRARRAAYSRIAGDSATELHTMPRTTPPRRRPSFEPT
jgi:hypothetical protein